MVRHPHRDGPPGLPQVPLQARLLAQHERQRSGPELLDERVRPVGDVDGEGLERGLGRDEHRRRHLAGPGPWRRGAAARRRVEGVGADAVDGVGRAARRAGRAGPPRPRLGQALLALGVVGRVVAGGHAAHRASRARHEARPTCQVRGGRVRRPSGRRRRRPPAPTRPGRRRARRRRRRRARSSRAATRSTTRIASSPSSPLHSASAGSWSRASRRHRLERLERDVRRVADHDVDVAVQVGEGVGHVAVPQVDPGAGEVAVGPGAAPPRRAPPRAPGPAAPRCATASAIAPEPVQRSTTTGSRAGRGDLARAVDRPARPAARSPGAARRRPGPTASSR